MALPKFDRVSTSYKNVGQCWLIKNQELLINFKFRQTFTDFGGRILKPGQLESGITQRTRFHRLTRREKCDGVPNQMQ